MYTNKVYWERSIHSRPLPHFINAHTNNIVCPWCYNQTKINEKLEENKCEVCKRVITEGDLENEIL